jgi:hypothetical protein
MTLDSAERQTEAVGYLNVRQIVVKGQPHHLPRNGFKPLEFFTHQYLIGHCYRIIGLYEGDIPGSDAFHLAASRSRPVGVRYIVAGNSNQPGRQPGPVRIEGMPTAPGCD